MTRLLAIAALGALCLGSSLPTLKYRALSSAGVPLSGAKLYFYETGTTTPLATYSDEALTSANANPVVSDSYGWFGEIYLKTDEAYRVRLTTSADVVQWTLNDVWAAQLTSSAFQTRIKQIASNPLDYGAVGDGVADESSYVQSAITNATNVVDLLGKTYRCDSTITVPSNRTIINGTLDFSNSANNYYITLGGTMADPVALDANAAVGVTSLSPTSSASFASGDWIYVESSDAWTFTYTAGEIYRVVGISGGNLTLDRPTHIAYTFATAAGVYKMTPVDNVELRNLTITGSTVASGTGNFIHGDGVTRLRINDVHAVGAKGSVVYLTRAALVDINGLSTDLSDVSTSYGVRIEDAALGITISDSSFRSLESGVYLSVNSPGTDGLTEDVRIIGNTFDDVDVPIYVWNTAVRTTISDNVISSTGDVAGGAIWTLGQPITISDNTILETNGTGIYSAPFVYATDATSRDDTVTITGNKVSFADDEGINVLGDGSLDKLVVSGNSVFTTLRECYQITASTFGHVFADGNTATSCGGHGVQVVGSGSNTGEFFINGNQINTVGTAYYGIYLTGAGTILNPRIVNNRVVGSMIYGVYVDGAVSGVVVDGNVVAGASTTMAAGIRLDGINGPEIRVTGNQVRDVDNASGIGIHIKNDTNVTTTPALVVSNNSIEAAADGLVVDYTSEAMTSTLISGNTIESDDGIVLTVTTASDDIVIANNVVTGTTGAATYTLAITGYASEIAITGNTFKRDDDLAHNILLSGTAAAAITNVNITGNLFENGDYAIGEGTDANTTNVLFSGNNMVGVLTGGAEMNTVVLGPGLPLIQSIYAASAWSGPIDPAAVSSTTMVWGTEDYDYGGILNNATGIFTSPITACWHISVSSYWEQNGADAGLADLGLTSNGWPTLSSCEVDQRQVSDAISTSPVELAYSCVICMDAGDTANAFYDVDGVAADLRINGSSISITLLR